MKISLEELSDAPENTITLGFHEVIEQLDNNKPVDGEITACLIPGGVKVEGHVETDLNLECDRCLENYPYHVDIDIDEIFIKGNLSSAKEIEISHENFVEELKGRSEIDITDLVYQSIILNTPSKKLCQEECPGTEELQQIQSEKPLDPRMEIFKKLYDEEISEDENKDNR